MFEKVVESVLEEYVSEWVEGLDSEKMKVALFAGKVEFRDLRVRGAALEKFQLPMKMKSGSVGRLSIKVPWKRLTSQGVKIQVEDVFLVVQPTDQDEAGTQDDDDSYLLRTRWAKQQEVKMLEILERVKSDGATASTSESEGDVEGAADSDPTASWGYKKKILNTILDNVSFEFTNIHIRYEDPMHVASKIPLALGLTIDSILISTTNANGQAEFVDRAQLRTAFVHRRLEMTQTSVYSDNIGAPEAKGQKGPSRSGSNIIHPFSTKINLARNHDQRTASTIPKLRCSAEISAIRACLTPQQSTFLIGIADFVSAHEMYLKRLHFQRNRPRVPIRSNPKLWWQYALHGVKELHPASPTKQSTGSSVSSVRSSPSSNTNPRRCDWKRFATLWSSRKEYIQLHKNMLRAAKKKKLDIETVLRDRSRLHELEDILDVHTIVFFRLCASRELEVKNQGSDSPRKLSQWKAKWSSGRTSSEDSGGLSSTQRDGLLDRLSIYLAVNERMHASSEARTMSIHEERSVEALLMALDLVVISFEVVLVEEYNIGDKSDTRDFLRFEMNEFVVTVLQRTSSSTISSRITSIQILDFRQTYEEAPLEKKEPQALLSLIDSGLAEGREGNSRKKPFVELSIDSSESKFRLDCAFERFRYIHNLYATSKLRAYFIPRPDPASASNKKAENTTFLPVELLRKTSIENAFGNSTGTPVRRNSKSASSGLRAGPIRDVEFSVRLPEVDIIIHTTDTSAEVEAKLIGTQFQNGTSRNTFLLGIEGAEAFFLEALSSNSDALVAESDKESSDISAGRSGDHRKYSTLMQNTRLEFHGEKLTEGYLVPKWQMTCTAPPMHLSMSSKQYKQLLQASAEWKAPSHGRKNAIAAPSAQFVVEDERLNVCVSIPHIIIGFEGEIQTRNELETGVSTEELIGFELEVRDLTMMARFSSVAQAAAIDLSSIALLKRDALDVPPKTTVGEVASDDTREASVQVTSEPATGSSARAPDPVYDRCMGCRTRKLLELSGKTTVLISSSDPLLGEVKIEQAALYWNHEHLVALVRSYLASQIDAIHPDSQLQETDQTDITVQDSSVEPPGRFAFQVQVKKWFVFFIPKSCWEKQISYELSGTDLRCHVSTLQTPYLCAKLEGLGGIRLTTSRLIQMESLSGDDDSFDRAAEETYTLMQARTPVTISLESAGFGALSHRGGAVSFYRMEGAEVEVKYLHSYWSPFIDHVTKEIAAFSLWIDLIRMPPGLLSLNERVKLEIELSNVCIVVPTGEAGNFDEGVSDYMEINLRDISATSRAYPEDSTVEQNGIQVGLIQIVTCLKERDTSEGSDIVAEGAEAEPEARKENIVVNRCCIADFRDVFTEYASLPSSVLKSRSNGQENTNTKITAARADIEDVLKKLELMCSLVKVRLSSSNNWAISAKRSTATEESGDAQEPQSEGTPGASAAAAATTATLSIALNPFQLELLSRILDNNFAIVISSSTQGSPDADELKVTDVEFEFGDIALDLLDPHDTSNHSISSKFSSSGSTIARICLERFQLAINGFASQRSQYRAISSKATVWKIDWENQVCPEDCSDDELHKVELRALCADIYTSGTEQFSKQGIDIVIDQRSPTPNNTLPLREFRLYLDTCALLPAIVEFHERLQYFASIDSDFPDKSEGPKASLDISVTTGFVHLMIAECLPSQFDEYDCEGKHCQQLQQPETDASETLKMICSGCVVGRYTTGDPDKTCAQLYGRNMSVKVSSYWPPDKSQSSASVVPLPPQGSISLHPEKINDASSVDRDVHTKYDRTVCDDFTIDVDTVTTDDNDTAIAVTLTHFHAVLCTVDVFFLAQVRKTLGLDDDLVDRSSKEDASEDARAVEEETKTKAISARLKPVSSEEDDTIEEFSSVVQLLLEDTSLTLLRQSGQHLSPIARVYSFRAMCKVSSKIGAEVEGRRPTSTEFLVQFSDESFSQPSSDNGVSVWGFNTALGSWEPIVEPWIFELTVTLTRDEAGEMTANLNFEGKEGYPVNLNMSSAMVDSLCLTVKEYDGILARSRAPFVPPTNVVSSDCYLINDTGAPITYWVTHDIGTESRGFTYAARQKPRREVLMNRAKVPLELMTSISPSLRAEQTVSFCWGDNEWHPLTDIPIRNTGKFVYAVRSQVKDADHDSHDSNESTNAPVLVTTSSLQPKVSYALLDISAVLGYRTFTISSQIRVFNETTIPIDYGVLDADGKTITEIGTIEPKEACSVPFGLVPQIWSVRVFVKPHLSQPSSDLERCTSTTLSAPPPSSAREHRWSNELFISQKDESTLHTASCSLVLDDYACKCQRMLDGTIPFHPSQICKANGSYFHAYSRVFTSSNSGYLQYAQMRLMSPLTLVNNCGVPIVVVMFALKKVRRTAGAAPDRENAHLVSSQVIPLHSRMDTMSSALQDETYCSISMSGSSWSKLFRVPCVLNPSDEESTTAKSSPSFTMIPPTTKSESETNVVLSLADFKGRTATLSVSFDSKENRERNAGHFMVIQPRFILRNSTALPLVFSPQPKFTEKIPGTKSMSMMARFAKSPFSQSRKKEVDDCCGTADLETIHIKLNALKDQASSSQGSSIVVDEGEQQALYYSEASAIMIQLKGNSQQSSSAQDFNLEVGANTSLRIYNESTKRWHDIVALFKQVDGSHATEVTFVERYLVLNQTDHELLIGAVKDIAKDRSVFSFAPNTTSEYSWWTHSSIPSDSCIRLKIQDVENDDSADAEDYLWSGKFSLHDVSETALKVSTPDASRICVLRIQLRVEAAVQVCVVVTNEDMAQFPLYRIINSCARETIWFKQVFDGVAKDVSAFQRGVTQSLAPGESICFGWDEAFFLPIQRELSVWYAPLDGTASSDYQGSILFDQPGESQQVEIPSQSAVPSASKRVYIRWHLKAGTKTMVAQDIPLSAERKQRVGKQTRELVVAAGESETKSAPGVTSEVVAQLKLPQLSLSLVTNQPDELLLFSAQDVDIAYANIDNDHDQCEIKIGCFQLDNQLSNAIFPVVIAPMVTKKTGRAVFREPSMGTQKNSEIRSAQRTERSSSSDESDSVERSQGKSKTRAIRPHFLHVSVLRLSYDDNVDYIKYFSAMMQPARIQIDDSFLLALAAFVTDCSDAFEKNYPSERRRLTSEASKAQSRSNAKQRSSTGSERRIYLETMQLHPVKIQLSLTLVNHFGEADASMRSPSLLRLPIAVTKALVSSTLSQIDSATLYLNALHLNHAFGTGRFLASTVQQHYALQCMRQLYSLIGSADILGNPVGLVTNLGVGVKDFFYEPAAGLVTSPQEFMLGLSRGTTSLFTHSLYGAFNAASKVTGTLSEGLATLSLDREYLAARRAQGPRKQVATHIGTGLIHGTKQLGQGIFAGVTGVLIAPAQGALHGGLPGFFEGVGKGLIGVALKPAAGVLDLAATTAAGITATTSALDRRTGLGKEIRRRREPRLLRVTSDQRVRVYAPADAFLSQLLLRLPPKSKLQLPNELYDGHVFLPNGRVLVATSLRLLLLEFASEGTFATLTAAITTSGSVPPPRVLWSHPVSRLLGAQHAPTGVAIHLGSSLAADVTLDASEKTNGDITTLSMSDLDELGSVGTDRVLSFLTELVVRHQRATAASCGDE